MISCFVLHGIWLDSFSMHSRGGSCSSRGTRSSQFKQRAEINEYFVSVHDVRYLFGNRMRRYSFIPNISFGEESNILTKLMVEEIYGNDSLVVRLQGCLCRKWRWRHRRQWRNRHRRPCQLIFDEYFTFCGILKLHRVLLHAMRRMMLLVTTFDNANDECNEYEDTDPSDARMFVEINCLVSRLPSRLYITHTPVDIWIALMSSHPLRLTLPSWQPAASIRNSENQSSKSMPLDNRNE